MNNIFQMIQECAIQSVSKFVLEFGQNQKVSNQKDSYRTYRLNPVALMPVSYFQLIDHLVAKN